MKKSTHLLIYLSVYLSIGLNAQINNSKDLEKIEGIKRNALYNLEEIKVRWKKAALENCPGIPCVSAPSFTCGTSTVSDVDGNVYETVAIVGTGVNQCWTKTNLKVTKYNDGTLIGDSTTGTWGTTGAALIGARTGYDVSLVPLNNYVGVFGYLYNWYAVNDSRKLCPIGWRVPTDSDWNKLAISIHSGADTSTNFQSSIAGTVLKSDVTNTTTNIGLGWNPGSPGTNTSGFSALPGGIRVSSSGSFFLIRNQAYFWSATESNGNPTNAIDRSLSATGGTFIRSVNSDKKGGYSVRCLKN